MIRTITRTLAFTPMRMPAIRPRLKVSLTSLLPRVGADLGLAVRWKEASTGSGLSLLPPSTAPPASPGPTPSAASVSVRTGSGPRRRLRTTQAVSRGRQNSAATDRSGRLGGGEQPTGLAFIGAGDQHSNPLQLQLWVLPPGIVGCHGRSQAVAAQQTDDQFGLCAAAHERHGHRRAVHALTSSN